MFKTWPFRFSDIDTTHKRPPPLLGEHNDEVLRGLLGLSEEETQLASQHAIGREPTSLAGQNAESFAVERSSSFAGCSTRAVEEAGVHLRVSAPGCEDESR